MWKTCSLCRAASQSRNLRARNEDILILVLKTFQSYYNRIAMERIVFPVTSPSASWRSLIPTAATWRPLNEAEGSE